MTGETIDQQVERIRAQGELDAAEARLAEVRRIKARAPEILRTPAEKRTLQDRADLIRLEMLVAETETHHE